MRGNRSYRNRLGGTVIVRLWGSRIAENREFGFGAFSARSAAPGLAGTNNHALIEPHGVSKFIEVVAVDSDPPPKRDQYNHRRSLTRAAHGSSNTAPPAPRAPTRARRFRRRVTVVLDDEVWIVRSA
jgi:hypothetical protein